MIQWTSALLRFLLQSGKTHESMETNALEWLTLVHWNDLDGIVPLFVIFYQCVSITAIEITEAITSTRYRLYMLPIHMLMFTLTNYWYYTATNFLCELSPLSTSKPSERIIINVNMDYLRNLSSPVSVCVCVCEFVMLLVPYIRYMNQLSCMEIWILWWW